MIGLPALCIAVPLADGFYWVESTAPTIAERSTFHGQTHWYTIASDDHFVGDRHVVIIAGPLPVPVLEVP